MADSESNTVIGEEQYEEARKNWLDTAKVAQRAKNEAKQKYNETGPGTPFVEWLLRKYMLLKSKLAEEQRTVEAEYQLPIAMSTGLYPLHLAQNTQHNHFAICYNCNLFTPWGRSHDDPKKQSIT
ncbi:unnamed protein product [Fusarium fujikuroi]|nr:unnamed protein product [Fusarium fujikuroi]